MIIAIDGHDASGKSTISSKLSLYLDGKLIRPFSGETGERIKELHKKQKFDELERFAKETLLAYQEKYKDERFVIFDRHWMTILTLLPGNMFRREFPQPKTILCYADLNCTKDRLEKRNDGKENEWDHSYYINLYKQLANQNDCIVIDTSNDPDPDEIVARLISELIHD